VKVRTLRILAAALGITCGTSVIAQEPAKLKLPVPATAKAKTPADNQKLADAVAAKLTTVSAMKSADIKLYTDNGTVTVMGQCKSDADKMAILKAVSTADGVTLVKDGLKTADVKMAVKQPQMPAMPPAPMPVNQAQAIGGPRVSMPTSTMAPGAVIGNPDIEPLPLGPAGGGMVAGAPPLPNHAWPTYAPYSNMSRVAYPTAYPHNAFPYIGPYYPFPKVPLGWRSVTLSWEDGHWWLGRKQTPQDYWRVKFGY
jgi:hypothetical protein